jgi:hypothetical protein
VAALATPAALPDSVPAEPRPAGVPSASRGPQLVDSRGTVVGPFAVDSRIGASVVIDAPGMRVAVPVQSTGLGARYNDSFQWWYTSGDCSGPAYLDAGHSSDLGTVADGRFIGLSAGKLVYAVPPWTRSPMHSFRRFRTDDDPETAQGACFRESITVGVVWGQARVFDLRRFAPPFRVE